MRSRRTFQSKIPEVNLVPMMDVLMTVLTFFIIISMTLTGRQLIGIDIPDSVEGTDEAETEAETVGALIVGLNADGEIIFEDQKVDFRQLTQRIRTYFSENPNGRLVLKADRELPYSEVANFLTDLRDIGSNRVSLAVE